MTDRRCIVCTRRDVAEHEQTCPECVGQSRRDLQSIVELVAIGEEYLDGLPSRSPGTPKDGSRSAELSMPGGDLLVMLSGGSEGRSAAGRHDEVNAAAHGDPPSVLHSLAWWEDDWRDIRGDGPGAWPARLSTTTDYLERQTTWAAQHHPAFNEYVAELTQLRSRLEPLLRTDDRPMRSPVPCLTCDARALKRLWRDDGLEDDWTCQKCRRTYTPEQYWMAVAEHERRQEMMTA